MLSKKVSPDDRVSCPVCFTSVTFRNLSRHRRDVHGNAGSVPARRSESVTTLPRSRSSSGDVEGKESTFEHPVSVAADPEDSTEPCSTHLLMEAALALLDQHHSFSEDQLIKYVGECFPEVPIQERRALVIGAVAGAQQAARFQFLFERNRNSPDVAKREMATNAGSALSFWNMGLRAQSRARPTPPLSAADVECVVTTQENTVAAVLEAVDLPVSLGVACRDMDLLQAAMLDSGVQELVNGATKPVETTAETTANNSDDHPPYQPATSATIQSESNHYIPTPLAQLAMMTSAQVPGDSLIVDVGESANDDLLMPSSAGASNGTVSGHSAAAKKSVQSAAHMQTNEQRKRQVEESKVRDSISPPRKRRGTSPTSRSRDRPAHHDSPRRQPHSVTLSGVDLDNYIQFCRCKRPGVYRGGRRW